MATSTIAREIKESQHLNEVRGQFRGEREFEVWDTNTETELDVSIARSATGLPKIGNFFSVAMPSLMCVSLDFTHRPGINQYHVLARYLSDPLYLPPIVTTFLTTERVWRAAGTPPDPSVPPGVDPYTDIGGTQIDENGHPVEAPIWRTKIILPKLYFADTIDDLPWGLWGNIVGSVNLEVFHGAPKQTVLYTGANNQPTSPDGNGNPTNEILGRHIVHHEFLYDGAYHFQQFPNVTQTGYMHMDPQVFLGPPIIVSYHARHVFWRRFVDIQSFDPLGV